MYRNQRSGVLVVFLVALFCYANTLGNEFVFDDLEIIVNNPLVTGEAGSTPGSIFTSHYWQHVSAGGNLYRPLTIATYTLNHVVGGLEPAGFHAVNLFLHGLCSVLVVFLALRLDMSTPLAVAAGLLFAAHPVHTEAVTGIVGRAELLATAGLLGAWVIHLSQGTGVVKHAMMAVCFLAGLLSKENAVVLPALILVGDLYRIRTGRTTWKATVPALVVCGAVVIGWIALRSSLLPDVGAPLVSIFAEETVITRVATSLTVLTRYLWLLVFPLHLSADYSFAEISPVDSLLAPQALVSGLVYLALTLASARVLVSRSPLRPESRQAGLGIMVFLLALAPVSNIFLSIGTIMGERLLYLPSTGWCLALPPLWGLVTARAGGNTRIWRRVGVGILVGMVVLYAVRTLDRNNDWKDQLTLFSRTVETSPRSAKAHFNLGVSLEDADRPDEALAAYTAALAIRPDHAKAHHNSGLLLAKQGLLGEAAGHLDAAVSHDPNLPDIFSSLGVVYTRLDRRADAERAFLRALEREPDHHDASYNLGTLLLMRSSPSDALPHLERAVATDGEDPDARYQLGLAYLAAARPDRAIEQMEEALRILPDLADAHLQIALAHLELGDSEQAAVAATRARAAGLGLPPELGELLR